MTCSSWPRPAGRWSCSSTGWATTCSRQRSGHAPFLRSLLPAAQRLAAGFPSTTATSMGSFGTGLPPGGPRARRLQVLDPGADRLLNELSWEDGPDPLDAGSRSRPSSSRRARRRRRHPGRAGLLRRLGPDHARRCAAAGSAPPTRWTRGSTRPSRRPRDAPRRWSTSTGASSTRSGTSTAASPGSGATSWSAIDAGPAPAGARGARRHRRHRHRRPRHGRRPARPADRPGPRRRAGGRRAAPRRRAARSQLYCEPGAAADVAARPGRARGDAGPDAQPRRGHRARAGSARSTAVDVPRIGDVVVAMRGNFAVVDSRTARPSCWRCSACTAR